jgi:hypothetical protein
MKLSLSHSVGVAGLVVASWLLSACSTISTSESGALGTAGVQSSPIAIETSTQSVIVTNNAGQAIEDVRIAIQPISTAPPFTSTLRRLENGEKREISLAQFRANDGTTFNPRFVKAKQVTVSAVDFVGKKHEVTTAWAH